MLLKEILSKNIIDQDLSPDAALWEISSLTNDSRQVTPGSLFVAEKGCKIDGVKFVPEAIAKGAKVVVLNKENEKDFSKILPVLDKSYYCIFVNDTAQFLRGAAKVFYNDPSQHIRTMGVTGTNGKTTITYLLESIFREAGKHSGVIGTIRHRVGEKIFPSKNTTPGFLENQKYLASMVSEELDYAILEVSSHALAQGRVDLINFKRAVFTNLTQDHLDYHGTEEEYFLAKSKLFTNLSDDAVAVINKDTPFGNRLISMTKAKVITYGIKSKADVTAEDIKLNFSGSQFTVVHPQGEFVVKTSFLGWHNVYNILAAASCALSEGIDFRKIMSGIKKLTLVPGRLESIDRGQEFSIFLDYAHTPDGLKNVLKALRDIRVEKEDTQGKIILVFGCGGDRDKGKRPLMGRIADLLADSVIVTSDNPRTEDPESIIHQILPGFKKKNYQVIVDRKKAIHQALKMANPGDIVLIAGKGHEQYQIFKDKTIEFNERLICVEFLKKRKVAV